MWNSRLMVVSNSRMAAAGRGGGYIQDIIHHIISKNFCISIYFDVQVHHPMWEVKYNTYQDFNVILDYTKR